VQRWEKRIIQIGQETTELKIGKVGCGKTDTSSLKVGDKACIGIRAPKKTSPSNTRYLIRYRYRYLVSSVVDPDPDPVGSVYYWLFWIRIRILYTDPDPDPEAEKLTTNLNILNIL